MHPTGSCKCQHCGEFFEVDARNRSRQRYCRKAPCRKASAVESRRRWLSQPDNANYFRGQANVLRVQAWREAHPGYWRRANRRRQDALQETLITQAPVGEREAEQDDPSALQETLTAQSPLLVGLISHLAGSALQEDIALMTRRLHSRGRAVLGIDAGRPDYAKTPHRHGSGAARAAPV
jgi:hypothetical protein